MRIPVVFRQARESRKMIYSVGNLSIESDKKKTVIKVIPLYNDANKRGTPYTFMEIPYTFTKELVNADITTGEDYVTYITTTISDICEIETEYDTRTKIVTITYHDLMKPNYEAMSMMVRKMDDECIIYRDGDNFIYDTEAKKWVKC